jgi:cytochrome P450
MTSLVQAHHDSDRLTEDEIVSMVLILTVAGQETTGQLMCSGLYHLLSNPEQLAELRGNRELMSGAIEEALRFDTATRSGGPRYALQDTELAGQPIARGESVMICLQGVNHDPDVFPDPLRFDIHRQAGRHMGFGYGHHHCLGSALARLELDVVWNAVLDHYSFIEAPANLAWKPRFMVRGLELLPLRVELVR